ncbi:hypothetical protein GCK72_019253 [Caenorhabditis remanei]|uniref:Uncharacterized protein n=1 Tax=Caenorhabditis remanei TaxID=31234 RepID=A0A6A5GC49_CAERE|nr:hypothetical protein GCK72_019253 [Caenorhabditis remanei]KAF1752698.1 hypothetical protein GCK72_019253 [Caenorhabditis remanei]
MDIQPLLSLLRPENMRSMAELATELSSMATNNMKENERDVQRTIAAPKPPTPEQRPSQMIGGAIQNLAFQGRNAFLDALDKMGSQNANPTPPPPPSTFPTLPPMTFGTPPLPSTPSTVTMPPIFGISNSQDSSSRDNTFDTGGRDVLGVREFKKNVAMGEKIREIRYAEPIGEALPEAQDAVPVEVAAPASASSAAAAAPTLSRPPAPTNSFDGSPFMQIARRFLQVGTGTQPQGASGKPEPLPQIGIQDLVPNADSNFGLPRGKGCLPFISEFMQIAYGKCQDQADEKTFDAWGEELRRAIMTGEIDLLKASQETCRRGAERQQCDSLREAVATCDVIASLEIGTQLQRAMKRCEEVSGMMDQSPAAVLGQLNNLISGEVAQGFFNNFLKNG